MTSLRNQRWPALLLAVALCVQPVPAAAQSDEGTIAEEVSGNGAVKFLDYALCAVSIVAASTGVGAVLAVLTCAKAAVAWWSE